MLVPPDEIGGNARLAQRLHDADVREPARAATREHDAHAWPVSSRAIRSHVVGTGDVMMRNAGLRDRASARRPRA